MVLSYPGDKLALTIGLWQCYFLSSRPLFITNYKMVKHATENEPFREIILGSLWILKTKVLNIFLSF